MKNLIISAKKLREELLNDLYRPLYHFAVPEDNGFPGDSNGAFFADGVYHLMYLYSNSETNGYHWGHISSVDLLHWRHHPDALTVDNGDRGCFSGGAFVDDDKTAYLSFWKFPSADEKGDNGGIALAYSKPPYEKWERMEPIAIEGSREVWGTMDMEINGIVEHISCADPSNIWKKDGWYYIQNGNKCVLDTYGIDENAEEKYKGDWTDLFRSKDLKKWEFVHRFYKNTHLEADWPDETEDDMCPSFLPLFDAKENGEFSGKWLQLFISHNKGCQYYVGTYKNEFFTPEHHGRMSWNDVAYFAPEALIDDKNRHIIWTWLRGNIENDFEKFGWSGVFGFPRTVWWQNDQLHMAPAGELDLLEYNKKIPEIFSDKSVEVNNGEMFRLKAEIDVSKQEMSGFSVKRSDDGKIYTDIFYDKNNNTLVFDATNSGKYGWKIKEEAPLLLEDDETLKLDIFIDKSVVEVYANEKQAICRRVYPENPADAVGIKLIGEKSNIIKIEISDMAPSNPY